MALLVDVSPNVLRWARERGGIAPEALVKRFPKYHDWEAGAVRPTYKQLQEFASVTYAPFGSLLLSEPLKEPYPIPDFRTVGGTGFAQPSANLLDTIYLCEFRQDWYHEYALAEGLAPVSIVGSATMDGCVEETAARIRAELKMDLGDRAELRTWERVMRQFIRNAEDSGILVMVSGVVGSNTSRSLDRNEFRGFALVDDLAPLIFINSVDAKAAQMFTLAHEIAHLALGQSAVSNEDHILEPTSNVEAWCNRLAAELLVPTPILRNEYRSQNDLSAEVRRLSSRFMVSGLVILFRLRDIGAIGLGEFQSVYHQNVSRKGERRGQSGGNFYATQILRISERFARALITSTLEGNTLYRDAYHLLSLKKESTFRKLTSRLGIS